MSKKYVAVPHIRIPPEVQLAYNLDYRGHAQELAEWHNEHQNDSPNNYPGFIPERFVAQGKWGLVDVADEHRLRPADDVNLFKQLMIESIGEDYASFERIALELMSLAKGHI